MKNMRNNFGKKLMLALVLTVGINSSIQALPPYLQIISHASKKMADNVFGYLTLMYHVTNSREYLIEAARQGNLDVVVKSIDKFFADVNTRNQKGLAVLYTAAENGHEAVTQFLLDKGADVNISDNDNYTPLHIAAQNGHEGVIKLLLDKGARIDMRTRQRNATPLFIATYQNHEEVVKLLLSKGANVNLQNTNGSTPLHLAAAKNRESLVRLLLDKGADVNIRDNINNATPLDFAAEQGHVGVVELLLSKQVNINEPTNDGFTPLHRAARKGHVSVVELLLSKQANINAQANNKETALKVAVNFKHEKIVAILLENGANAMSAIIPLRNENGRFRTEFIQSAVTTLSNSSIDILKIIAHQEMAVNKDETDKCQCCVCFETVLSEEEINDPTIIRGVDQRKFIIACSKCKKPLCFECIEKLYINEISSELMKDRWEVCQGCKSPFFSAKT